MNKNDEVNWNAVGSELRTAYAHTNPTITQQHAPRTFSHSLTKSSKHKKNINIFESDFLKLMKLELNCMGTYKYLGPYDTKGS